MTTPNEPTPLTESGKHLLLLIESVLPQMDRAGHARRCQLILAIEQEARTAGFDTGYATGRADAATDATPASEPLREMYAAALPVLRRVFMGMAHFPSGFLSIPAVTRFHGIDATEAEAKALGDLVWSVESDALATPRAASALDVERLLKALAVLEGVPHSHEPGFDCVACRRDGGLSTLARLTDESAS